MVFIVYGSNLLYDATENEQRNCSPRRFDFGVLTFYFRILSFLLSVLCTMLFILNGAIHEVETRYRRKDRRKTKL